MRTYLYSKSFVTFLHMLPQVILEMLPLLSSFTACLIPRVLIVIPSHTAYRHFHIVIVIPPLLDTSHKSRPSEFWRDMSQLHVTSDKSRTSRRQCDSHSATRCYVSCDVNKSICLYLPTMFARLTTMLWSIGFFLITCNIWN